MVGMGHLIGLFDQPWLGIPPTRRIVMLRYAEFNRVGGDRIVDRDVCRYPASHGTGRLLPLRAPDRRHARPPGPRTHDGLCYAPQDPDRGRAVLGATYTIERYLRQHSKPIGKALSDGYRFYGHLCRVAEVDFGGFCGWANLTVRNGGDFMGMTAGMGPADMRVLDLYRVQDGKLAENWIFIDLLHCCAQQGLDVLGRSAAMEVGGG